MNANPYQSNNYQDMAREFLDVWQKQITSVVGDKQFIQAFLEMFQNMQKQNQNYAANAANPSHSSTASNAGGDMLAQLAFRLAMCEKRLAALEGKKTAAAKPKPRKRTTAKRHSG